MNKHGKCHSRRKFLASSAALVTGFTAYSQSQLAAPAVISSFSRSGSLIRGVQIGCITYSFRSMPDQSAEATLQYILDAGISAVELMGGPAELFAGAPTNPLDIRAYFGLRRKNRDGIISDNEKLELAEMEKILESYNNELATWRATVSMDKFQQLRRMYNDAGVQIYAYKPSAFGKNNSLAEMEYGMNAAKTLGASHVTLEHPSDDAHTLKLGQIGAKHNIYVGYHGHEQQTPTFWDTALAQSAFNTLNIDIGHYVAAGNADPLGILKAKHNRISSMHLKDRQTPEHDKGNLVFGEGDTPIVDILHLIRDGSYKFPVTIELEYDIPADSDAVKEVAKCLAYCRNALEA